MDERVKHRIIGFIVIFALIAIITPILLKSTKPVWKSIQTSTTFQIPHAKLRRPKMVIEEKSEEWKKPLKPAHVLLTPETNQLNETKSDTNKVALSHEKPAIKKVSLISELQVIPPLPLKEKPIAHEVQKAPDKPKTKQTAKVSFSHKPPFLTELTQTKSHKKTTKRRYQVVLGTFKKQENVEALLKKLKIMGYKAHFRSVSTRKGVHYRQVILTQTYANKDTLKLLKLFNDKLHIRGVVRRA